jgi:serine/threonine protein kinase
MGESDSETESVAPIPPDSSFELDKHEIIRPLATGGMAQLFLAWQYGAGGVKRRVVVKRIHRHLVGEPEFVEMFLNEARIAAGLSHPNIVHIYDVVETNAGDTVLVMEYVNGVSVHALLRAARQNGLTLPLGFAVHIAIAVAEALEYAYAAAGADGVPLRIVHRDVSPSNVLVSVEGRIKLVDFGIAKALANASVTKAGHVKGKYRYMAPEQLKGEPLDARTDLFALGAMLYEMTTGSRAFAGSSDAEIITALLTCEVEPPSRRVADYPPELERIVLRCLSRERGGRPSSGRELIEELEACAVSCDWTMRSVSLGVFVRSLFPAHLEAEAPSASGPRASAPRSSTPTPPVSAPRQMSTLPMIGPDALMQAEIDVTVDYDAGPRQPLRDASTLLIVTFLVVASALFWLVVYPRLG